MRQSSAPIVELPRGRWCIVRSARDVHTEVDVGLDQFLENGVTEAL